MIGEHIATLHAKYVCVNTKVMAPNSPLLNCFGIIFCCLKIILFQDTSTLYYFLYLLYFKETFFAQGIMRIRTKRLCKCE